MPFIGPLNKRERRISRSRRHSRWKNVTCLLSDRSRALAKAIVLKRQDDILFLENHGKGTKILFFNIKIPSCLC